MSHERAALIAQIYDSLMPHESMTTAFCGMCIRIDRMHNDPEMGWIDPSCEKHRGFAARLSNETAREPLVLTTSSVVDLVAAVRGWYAVVSSSSKDVEQAAVATLERAWLAFAEQHAWARSPVTASPQVGGRFATEGVAVDADVPIVDDFFTGTRVEMDHQIRRWGRTHDKAKTAEDWFWLLGFLAGKALAAVRAQDREKALHHCISSAAVLGHWHEAIKGATATLKVEHEPSKERA